MVVYLLIAAVVLVVAYYMANEFYGVACTKGYTEKKYFWICFWLGFAGYLLVIALPAKHNKAENIADELPEI